MKRILPAIALAVASIATPAKADVSCYLEASAAKNITSTRVDNGALLGTVTVQADGLQGGIGGGCDYLLGSGFKFGVLGRADRPDIKTDFATGTFSGSNIYTGAGRLGYMVNPGVEVYALAGMSWTDLNIGGTTLSPKGYLYGAGIEINTSNLMPHTSIIVEYARTNWDASTIAGTKLSPESDVIRIGVHYVVDFGSLAK